MRLTFSAKLWRWPGNAAWHFVTVPKALGVKIKAAHTPKRGFGSVRVAVCVGKSKWSTSIFPDSRAGTYLLPIKAAIRRAEQLEEGDLAHVKLTIIT